MKGVFISQIATCPLAVCHRMSERPLSKKSPVPTACQADPGLGPTDPPPSSVFPFTFQIATCPPLLCQRMLSVIGASVTEVRSNGLIPVEAPMPLLNSVAVVPFHDHNSLWSLESTPLNSTTPL
jgi:hypothetical protein